MQALRVLRGFRRLSSEERRLLLSAVLWMHLVGYLLRLCSLIAMRDLLARGIRRRSVIASPARIAELVGVAASYAFAPVTCLTRSLVLLRLLACAGIAGDLRIGVRLDAGQMNAHAWVEVDGVPINDQVDVASRYCAFEGAPGRASWR